MGDEINMSLEVNIQRIVNKVVSLPMTEWTLSREDHYQKNNIRAYEAKYLGRTLTVMCTEEGSLTLWYDGTMITAGNNEVKNLFASLHAFAITKQEEVRQKKIEELAKHF